MLVGFGNIKINLKNMDLISELTFELTFLSAINPPVLMENLSFAKNLPNCVILTFLQMHYK